MSVELLISVFDLLWIAHMPLKFKGFYSIVTFSWKWGFIHKFTIIFKKIFNKMIFCCCHILGFKLLPFTPVELFFHRISWQVSTVCKGCMVVLKETWSVLQNLSPNCIICLWKGSFYHCQGALLYLTVLNINHEFCKATNNNQIYIVLLDISKVNDKVWYKSFLYKLYHLHIRGSFSSGM